MAVIPLTLVISLCLVFTFVVFFLLEHSRNRYGSSESQAILPLADETPLLVPVRVDYASGDRRRSSSRCGCQPGDPSACAACRQRFGS
jgi:hypothetical protein